MKKRCPIIPKPGQKVEAPPDYNAFLHTYEENIKTFGLAIANYVESLRTTDIGLAKSITTKIDPETGVVTISKVTKPWWR